jgi:hypothetical protein
VPLVWMFVLRAAGSSSPERRRRRCPPYASARRRRRHGMPLLSSHAHARRPGANPQQTVYPSAVLRLRRRPPSLRRHAGVAAGRAPPLPRML